MDSADPNVTPVSAPEVREKKTWPRNTSGLIHFRRGQAPLGQRKLPVTAAYHRWLMHRVPDEMFLSPSFRVLRAAGLRRGATWCDLVALRMVLQAAVRGDHRAAKETTDRVEGKVPVRLEIADGRPQNELEAMTPEERLAGLEKLLMSAGHAQQVAHRLAREMLEV